MSELQVGVQAPDFELPDQAGKLVRLSNFHGKNSVVLFFYPKDDTRVCTQEVCAFRDDYAQFRALGAKVFGISVDTIDSHDDFASKHRLQYPLLSDKGAKVAKSYGVKKMFGLFPGRVTFVIDPNGVVRLNYSDPFEAQEHVIRALRALKGNSSATLP